MRPYIDNLSFATVNDITKQGAYDEALKDVTYVVHMASPLAVSSEDFESDIIQPAVRGTMGILYSALRHPSIKRVVITGSVVSVIDDQDMLGGAPDKV